MKKDKPSKKKSKSQESVKPEINTPLKYKKGIISSLFEKFITNQLSILEKPFKFFTETPNPFIRVDPERVLIFAKVIAELHSFALDCAELVWIVGNRDQVKVARQALYNKRDDFISLVGRLIPIEAEKQAPHEFIRICKYEPPFLRSWVNHIWSELKEDYSRIKRDETFRALNRDSKRKKAVESYLNEEFELDYELFSYSLQRLGITPYKEKGKLLELMSTRQIYSRNDPFTHVALRIISTFTGCSFDALLELYKPRKA